MPSQGASATAQSPGVASWAPFLTELELLDDRGNHTDRLNIHPGFGPSTRLVATASPHPSTPPLPLSCPQSLLPQVTDCVFSGCLVSESVCLSAADRLLARIQFITTLVSGAPVTSPRANR